MRERKRETVVILCGGRGTRLQEETEFKPKALVEIGGRPILWHLMRIYHRYGYRRFVLALGYKGEMIKDYFLNYRWRDQDLTIELKSGACTSRSGDDESAVVIRFREHGTQDFPYLLQMLHGSYMSRPNSIVVPGGKMGLAMELILAPRIHELIAGAGR